MSGISKELGNILNNKYSYDDNTNRKLLEVLFLADKLLEKNQIKETEILFRNHQHAYATCSNFGNCITILLDHAINGEISDIKNTILHEIAHVLVGCENGHNETWQKKAIEMGVIFTINYRK